MDSLRTSVILCTFVLLMDKEMLAVLLIRTIKVSELELYRKDVDLPYKIVGLTFHWILIM